MRRALLVAWLGAESLALLLGGCASTSGARAPAASAVDAPLPATDEDRRRELASLVARIDAARATVEREEGRPSGETHHAAPPPPAAAPSAPAPEEPPSAAATGAAPPSSPPPTTAAPPSSHAEETPSVRAQSTTPTAATSAPPRSRRCRRVDEATRAICDAAHRIARLADALADDDARAASRRADDDCRAAEAASATCR